MFLVCLKQLGKPGLGSYLIHDGDRYVINNGVYTASWTSYRVSDNRKIEIPRDTARLARWPVSNLWHSCRHLYRWWITCHLEHTVRSWHEQYKRNGQLYLGTIFSTSWLRSRLEIHSRPLRRCVFMLKYERDPYDGCGLAHTLGIGLGILTVYISRACKPKRKVRLGFRIERDVDSEDWMVLLDSCKWSKFIAVKAKLFGYYKGDGETIESVKALWEENGVMYRGTFSIVRYVQHRSKCKLFKRTFHRLNVDLDEGSAKFHNPKRPERPTISISYGIGYDPIPKDWITWIRDKVKQDHPTPRIDIAPYG